MSAEENHDFIRRLLMTFGIEKVVSVSGYDSEEIHQFLNSDNISENIMHDFYCVLTRIGVAVCGGAQ